MVSPKTGSLSLADTVEFRDSGAWRGEKKIVFGIRFLYIGRMAVSIRESWGCRAIYMGVMEGEAPSCEVRREDEIHFFPFREEYKPFVERE